MLNYKEVKQFLKFRNYFFNLKILKDALLI